jgi:uncharacterized protein YecE (DUF72 family)
MEPVRKGKVHIGTSGWHYKHLIGKFYPDDLATKDQLNYYLIFFDTVEINNSFYRLPSADTFSQWKEGTPDKFLFSVKASRYITHMKKLNEAGDALDLLLNNATGLDRKLGTVLFQLPPRWNLNVQRFQKFLKLLPASERFVFEFRDHSWYTRQVYQMLRDHNCAFCIYDLAGHTSPVEVTADFVYVRLHGPGDKYQGSYEENALQQWANKLINWVIEGKDVYVYFDNDQDAFAVFNALTLKDMVDVGTHG